MTITRRMLDTELQSWFHNVRNAEKAKEEILARFSAEAPSASGAENSAYFTFSLFLLYYTLAAIDCFPDHTRCIRPAVPKGKAYHGAELILTLSATPEPVLIDEGMVNNMLSEYKSHFLKEISRQKAAQ